MERMLLCSLEASQNASYDPSQLSCQREEGGERNTDQGANVMEASRNVPATVYADSDSISSVFAQSRRDSPVNRPAVGLQGCEASVSERAVPSLDPFLPVQ